MAAITTRATAGAGATVKGSNLTNAEVDANFIGLNDELFVDALPVIRPTLLLDFVNQAALDPRLTFNRSSSATYVDSAGVVRLVGNDVPRFDFDPVTGESRGLLIEDSKTNLAINSETHTEATLGFPQGTSPPSIAIATYQGLTVEAITFPAGVAGYSASNRAGAGGSRAGAWSMTNGVTYTASCYVALSRPLTGGESIIVYQTGNQGMASVNLTAATPNPTTLQRYSVTDTSNTNGSQGTYVFSGSGALTSPVTVYITRFQVEAASFASSYIPTAAAQVTRAADRAFASLSPWFRAASGSWFVDSEPLSSLGSQTQFAVSAGSSYSTGNGMLLRFNGSSAAFGGNSQSVSGPAGSRQGIGYEGVNASLVVNGSSAFTLSNLDFTGTGSTTLVIGALTTGGQQQGNFRLRRLAFYPKRLTDAELRALTL